MLVCTLGDLLLDVIVRPEHQLVRGDDTPALARACAGGQAANVAAWAVALGAQGRLIASRGSDEVGRLVSSELAARGVEIVGPTPSGSNGVVVSIVDPDGERSMLSDPGVASELRAEELNAVWLKGCDVLHLSGYALYRRPIDEAAAKAVGAVRAQGGRVSIDLAASTAIREFGSERALSRLRLLAPDVVFAGEHEVEALGTPPPGATLVLKRGAHGCVVDTHGTRTEYPASSASVRDTTGAGDALAAGFLVGGPELALEAAARCVAQLGAMP